jgi:hypothetical protein
MILGANLRQFDDNKSKGESSGEFQAAAFGPSPKGGKVFLYGYSVFCLRVLKDLSYDNLKCTRKLLINSIFIAYFSSPEFLCRSWKVLHHWSDNAFTIT